MASNSCICKYRVLLYYRTTFRISDGMGLQIGRFSKFIRLTVPFVINFAARKDATVF